MVHAIPEKAPPTSGVFASVSMIDDPSSTGFRRIARSVNMASMGVFHYRRDTNNNLIQSL